MELILMKGYIYLIENKINGKKYVGKTYNSIEHRWKEHLRDFHKERNRKRPLYKAMMKYGLENFTISELEYCENCEEREKYWINHYNTYHNGYNATLGGDGKCYFGFADEEVIQKYNELKSVKETAHYFNCDIETISKRLRNNNILIPKCGNLYSEQRTWKTRKINQYSLENKLLNSFNSCSDAADWVLDNNLSTGQKKHIVSNISKCARGIENRKQAYGFIWKNEN